MRLECAHCVCNKFTGAMDPTARSKRSGFVNQRKWMVQPTNNGFWLDKSNLGALLLISCLNYPSDLIRLRKSTFGSCYTRIFFEWGRAMPKMQTHTHTLFEDPGVNIIHGFFYRLIDPPNQPRNQEIRLYKAINMGNYLMSRMI